MEGMANHFLVIDLWTANNFMNMCPSQTDVPRRLHILQIHWLDANQLRIASVCTSDTHWPSATLTVKFLSQFCYFAVEFLPIHQTNENEPPFRCCFEGRHTFPAGKGGLGVCTSLNRESCIHDTTYNANEPDALSASVLSGFFDF